MSPASTAAEALHWAAEKCDEYAGVMETLGLQELRGLACRIGADLRDEAARLEAKAAEPIPKITIANCVLRHLDHGWHGGPDTRVDVQGLIDDLRLAGFELVRRV